MYLSDEEIRKIDLADDGLMAKEVLSGEMEDCLDVFDFIERNNGQPG